MMDHLVFVDKPVDRGWRLGANAHLLPGADTPAALDLLHTTAAALGLRREWFQEGRWPHYDLTRKRYAAAVTLPQVVAMGGTAYVRMRRCIHEERFVEPGSGLTMSPKLWYALSDSGSAYRDAGFDTSAAAVAWVQGWPHWLDKTDITVHGRLRPQDGIYPDANLCNIVQGWHLLVFWCANGYGALLQV